MQIIGDEEVRRTKARDVVECMREALVMHGRRELVAPPRARSALGSLDYVYTAGSLPDGTSGFRAYRAGQPAGDQLVAVWNGAGDLEGLIVGDELGIRRTGALGAVAADVLARPEAESVAVIGSGPHAWAQLWALAAVRHLRRVRVHSRTTAHAVDFAERAARELGLNAVAVTDSADAVSNADIIVLATRSPTPVIDLADVGPGTHVTTLGPKSYAHHETPLALLDAATVVTCDSPAQAAAYPDPFFTDPDSLVCLGGVLLGEVPGRRSAEDITMHCSVGLAGSEILLASRLLAASRS
ncbi:ornithine cyclodeaminase family protein [Arthrobacter rhombi]|uniref:ornithine cyclodeaminase family protein n=1 Tax=Micrococcaceae TaxID=1268 RepID=UPI000BB722A0|nr:ornithine cyclodeaminase family protein [Glutamicibacter sp. BW78]PCC24298.1 hypothetical protein CIK75_13630 [Glutamicibacter sp. BW78]